MKKTILLTAVALITLAGSNHCNAQWSLTGNAGTVGTNFLGTTDNVALKFKTKNLNRMIITGGGNVGIGTTTPTYKLDVTADSRFNGITVGRGAGNVSTNTALGSNALAKNISAVDNTAAGYYAQNNNIDGARNSAFGTQALVSNQHQSDNTAIGYHALYFDSLGSYNTAVGSNSLVFLEDGSYNTATGFYSQLNNQLGTGNTGDGYASLYSNAFGNNNTGIGASSDVTSAFLSNATAIGFNAKANSDNKIRLGDANVTVIEGQVAYSFPSDARFKNNIKDNIPGLDFIKQLKPVTYNFDTKKFEEHLMQNMPESIKEERLKGRDFTASSKIIHSGFLAQDIEKTCKQLGYDFDGLHIPDAENKTDNYSVAYSQFIMPLVKAVQELNAKNESLEKQTEVKVKAISDLQRQNAAMQNQINDMQQCVQLLCENSALKNSSYSVATESKLIQNQPNPFNQSTVIRYASSIEHSNGAIVIRDLSGNTVKSIAINNFGKGQVTVNANELAQGTYTYTLEIADESMDTKLMVITK